MSILVAIFSYFALSWLSTISVALLVSDSASSARGVSEFPRSGSGWGLWWTLAVSSGLQQIVGDQHRRTQIIATKNKMITARVTIIQYLFSYHKIGEYPLCCTTVRTLTTSPHSRCDLSSWQALKRHTNIPGSKRLLHPLDSLLFCSSFACFFPYFRQRRHHENIQRISSNQGLRFQSKTVNTGIRDHCTKIALIKTNQWN